MISFVSEWLKEFDGEMSSTRRVLERVPTDKGQWRPHPKSFPIGHLAQLIAGMPGWSAKVARGENIDLAKGGSYTFEPTEKLLAVFDKNVAETTAAVGAMREGDLDEPWSLTMGERTLMTLP